MREPDDIKLDNAYHLYHNYVASNCGGQGVAQMWDEHFFEWYAGGVRDQLAASLYANEKMGLKFPIEAVMSDRGYI